MATPPPVRRWPLSSDPADEQRARRSPRPGRAWLLGAAWILLLTSCSHPFIKPLTADLDLIAQDPLLAVDLGVDRRGDPLAVYGDSTYNVSQEWSPVTATDAYTLVEEARSLGVVFESIRCNRDDSGFRLTGDKLAPGGYLVNVSLYLLEHQDTDDLVRVDLSGSKDSEGEVDPTAPHVERVLTPKPELRSNSGDTTSCPDELWEALNRDTEGHLQTE